MRFSLVVAASAVIGFASASAAGAAVFLRLSATTVHRGGVVRLVGNASGMPLYALPAERLPCARYGTCAEPIHSARAPKRPFVFLGRLPLGPNTTSTRAVSLRLPRGVRAGRYKIFVWCTRCGGSLLIAGTDSSGQTLRVLR